MKLNEILKNVEIEEIIGASNEELANIEIEEISEKANNIVKKTLYVLSESFDGPKVQYVVCEKSNVKKFKDSKIIVQVKNINIAKVNIAKNFYMDPAKNMKLIGITGTKGKTTVSFMVRQMIDKVGLETGVIGTIYTAIGNKVVLQNQKQLPGIIELYKLLRIMANEDVRYVIMEISVEDLRQAKIEGLEFEYGIFTNIIKEEIEEENLDLMEYLEQIQKLFKASKFSIINEDDLAADYIKEVSNEYMTYGYVNKSDHNAINISVRSKGTGFRTMINGTSERLNVKIPENNVVWNSLAAIVLGECIKLPTNPIKEAIEEVFVPGRFEVIENYKDLSIIVDEETRPEKVRNILKKAEKLAPGRVIVVIGSEEGQGEEVRKELGNVIGKNGDYIIITSLNPRGESPIAAAKQILKGVREAKAKALIMVDRKEAIEFAISKTKERDILVILGMGNAKFMEMKEGKIPFNDKNIVKEYFKKMEKEEKSNVEEENI